MACGHDRRTGKHGRRDPGRQKAEAAAQGTAAEAAEVIQAAQYSFTMPDAWKGKKVVNKSDDSEVELGEKLTLKPFEYQILMKK